VKVPATLSIALVLLALPAIASASDTPGWAGTVTTTYISTGPDPSTESTGTLTGTADGRHPQVRLDKRAPDKGYASVNPGNAVWHSDGRFGDGPNCQNVTEDINGPTKNAVRVVVDMRRHEYRADTFVGATHMQLHRMSTRCDNGALGEDRTETLVPDVGFPIEDPSAMQCAQGSVGYLGAQRLPARWDGVRLKSGYDCTGSPVIGFPVVVRVIASWNLRRVGKVPQPK
jgi:hypothetical protein